ncbi:MAG: amidase [Actinomycetota bacterium]|nr:amidase [Actinomycetota bacterium]MDA3024066.1 amidase [Actinomycetota bacterium]
MSDELWRKTARQLAEMIARGDVSSREVVDSHLTRIDAVNPRLNAIVHRLDEQARIEADRADAARRSGDSLAPLHGVPCTVKENIDLAGTPTTNAVPALAHAISSSDAPIVERIRRAGAIPIGRTNLPDMGLRIHTDSSLHGLTHNPWDHDRTAGGSSGGEAAALASGMSPIGLGNDIGGSLRNPAHCCGVASIKPTQGVVPWATEIPPTALGLASQLMLVDGVMARRIDDVRIGFDAIRGAHSRDPYSVPADLAGAPSDRPWRIAVMTEVPGGRTDPGISSVVRATADMLSNLGHDVVEAIPPRFDATVEMWSATLNAELSVMQPLLDGVLGQDARQFLEFGRQKFPQLDQSAVTFLHAQRHELAREWSEWFVKFDVLVSPTWALPAFTHGFDVQDLASAEVVLETFRPVLAANLFGSPAAVVPAGISEGLPVGVHVSSWRYRDLLCLDVASVIDQHLGLATPIEPTW